jgi:hypothetical protein
MADPSSHDRDFITETSIKLNPLYHALVLPMELLRFQFFSGMNNLAARTAGVLLSFVPLPGPGVDERSYIENTVRLTRYRID